MSQLLVVYRMSIDVELFEAFLNERAKILLSLNIILYDAAVDSVGPSEQNRIHH
jgi:hypothetical protein